MDQKAKVRSIEQDFLMPGAQTITVLADLVVDKAKGAEVWDITGKRYIDFFTGVGSCSIGHNHPHFVSMVTSQLCRNVTGSLSSEVRAAYLQLLSMQLPSSLNKVQLYTTGSEAVEAALKLAKSVTGRVDVLSFWGGFHGKTLGSLSVHGGPRKRDFGALVPGASQAPYAYCYRCPLALEYGNCSLRCVDLVRSHLENSLCGPLAAIIVEPVQGTNGNVAPPKEFLQDIAKLAAEHRAILIFDEVITGFGRTGRMFAFEDVPGVIPDILILGKGMASGIPASAVVYKGELLREGPFLSLSAAASTFGGNPLSCSAALATLEVLLHEHVLDNVCRLAAVFRERSMRWKEKYSFVGRVHQSGLMIGIELVRPESSKEPLAPADSRALFSALLDKGLLSMSYEPKIRLYPPLTIAEDLFSEALDIIETVFDDYPWKR